MSRIVATLFAVLAIACSTSAPRRDFRQPAVGREDDPDARDRWFWEQRVYPTGTIPVEVHREAVRRELAIKRALTAESEGWTNLGPAPLLDITYGLDSAQNSSGRALTLAIHPHDPRTLLLGTAQGGIGKSTDRGASWRPVGELSLPTLAVGIIKYSPEDVNVVFASNGEPNGSTSIHGAGVLKSTDGGETWSVLPARGAGWDFEYAAITGLHFDARDASTMYVSTAVIQSATSFFRTPPDRPQTGVFKSTDGGQSWTLILPATRHQVPDSFSAGIIDLEYGGALAPDLLYASEYYGGILKSQDGGATWRSITARKENGMGAFPADVPRISYLDPSQFRNKLLTRLPNPGTSPDFRRPEIALSASNPQILYAGYDGQLLLLDYDGNGIFELQKDRRLSTALLFKSIDGGETWEWLGTRHDGIPDFCGGQCAYDYAITVNPSNADDVWIGGSAYYGGVILDPVDEPRVIYETPWRGMVYRSRDGGRTWIDTTPHCTSFSARPARIRSGLPVHPCTNVDPTRVIHPDTHAIILGADQSVYVANDGGLYRTSVAPLQSSPSRGKRRAVGKRFADPLVGFEYYKWENLNNNLSTLQFYRIGSHPTNPNILLGGMQDNSMGYWDGSAWHGWGGGDGTIAIFDPVDPRYVYLGTQFFVHRHDDGGTKDFSDDSTWVFDVFPGADLVEPTERTSFVPVFTLDPVDPRITYGASNEGVYRSTERGAASQRLVPEEKTEGVPTWISVSPVDHNVVWVGTSTGAVYRYEIEPSNGTATRTRIGHDLPDRYVSRVIAGHDSADTVYAVFNGYDANTPSTPGKVFLSTDRGVTWRNISADLPDVPATAIALDPLDVNRIWISTDAAVYSTHDRGATWQSERRNMPLVAIQDLDYNARTGFLVAATHGRGVWRMQVGEGARSAR